MRVPARWLALVALGLGLPGVLAQATSGASSTGSSTAATSADSTAAPDAGDHIIKPRQVWTVTGTLPGGSPQTYRIELGYAPGLVKDGMVIYTNYLSDAAGNLTLTRLWHDPLDQDPEFLNAVYADSDGERDCLVLNPSNQADLTRFTGVFTDNQDTLKAYVDSGKMTANLGRCTITLVR